MTREAINRDIIAAEQAGDIVVCRMSQPFIARIRCNV